VRGKASHAEEIEERRENNYQRRNTIGDNGTPGNPTQMIACDLSFLGSAAYTKGLDKERSLGAGKEHKCELTNFLQFDERDQPVHEERRR